MKKHRSSTLTTAAFCGLAAFVAVLLAALCVILPTAATDTTPEDPITVPKTLRKIEISSAPDKKIYDIGDAFSAAGLRLRLIYSDGSAEIKSGDASMCSGFDSLSAGEKTVKVTYRGFTTEFTVSVRKMTGISVKSKPNKSVYFVGEDIDLRGLELTATYSAGPAVTVYEGYELRRETHLGTAGEITVTVRYMGFDTTFTVTVKEVKPESVEFVAPSKTVYSVGDKFDGAGAAFRVKYNDGSSKTVTEGITFSGFSSDTEGEKTVTAKWGDYTRTFKVTVKAASHKCVAGGDRVILKQPTCTEYGQAVRYCRICGAVAETARLDMTGHTFGEWRITKAATATADGERTRACTVCGKTETETLPRLTSILFDGDRGSAAASGGYSFPNGSALGIKDVTSSLGADERKKLEDAAKADGMTLVAVIDVAFTQNGKSFSPEGTLTLVLKIQSGSAGKYRIYKSGARLADATCADGYVTFAASGAFGRFAVAFAAVPDGTTAHDSTASDTTPTTSAPDTAPEGPDSTSELTPALPESSDASAETTKEGINSEALQKTIKTVLIVVVAIVVIGAMFYLLYIYLKNKYML